MLGDFGGRRPSKGTNEQTLIHMIRYIIFGEKTLMLNNVYLFSLKIIDFTLKSSPIIVY